jgi:hypothetical protein
MNSQLVRNIQRPTGQINKFEYYANGKGCKTFDEALLYLMRVGGGELTMPNGNIRTVKVDGDEVELI